MTTTALTNGKIFTNGELIEANLLIENGKISEITKKTISNSADKIVNCKGKIILPGAIDVHVHLRTPGLEHKEDITTGSKAALHGGVTTIFDMPNTLPPTVTAEELEAKRKLYEKNCLANYSLYLGCTAENLGEIEKAEGIKALKIYMGSSTGDLLLDSLGRIEKVFELARKKNLVSCMHAESETCIKMHSEEGRKKGYGNAFYHSIVRPSKCAEIAVENAIELARRIGNKLHVCHTTTGKELGLVAKAKKEKLRVSCEVAPHHLFLSRNDAKKLGNYGKMNPPLREKKDVAALWKGLKNGTVDCIATDHAPHTKEEKEKNYWEAPSGVPGLETSLPLMLDAIGKRKIVLQKVVELMAENPARIFGIAGKGKIAEGFNADLTIVDLKQTWKVKGDELFTKCKWSPFEGWKLKGKVCQTIVNGNLAYDNGNVEKKINGKEI